MIGSGSSSSDRIIEKGMHSSSDLPLTDTHRTFSCTIPRSCELQSPIRGASMPVPHQDYLPLQIGESSGVVVAPSAATVLFIRASSHCTRYLYITYTYLTWYLSKCKVDRKMANHGRWTINQPRTVPHTEAQGKWQMSYSFQPSQFTSN